MAFTGHRTSKEISRYTKAARQKVLGAQALEKLLENENKNKSVPLFEAVEQSETKLASNALK